MNERIPLPRVAGKVREQTGLIVPNAYKKLYSAVLDGRLPAEQGADGRYMISSAHLPEAATILGQLPEWVETRLALRDRPKQTAA
jgi:hypothetical protein